MSKIAYGRQDIYQAAAASVIRATSVLHISCLALGVGKTFEYRDLSS